MDEPYLSHINKKGPRPTGAGAQPAGGPRDGRDRRTFFHHWIMRSQAYLLAHESMFCYEPRDMRTCIQVWLFVSDDDVALLKRCKNAIGSIKNGFQNH